MSLPASLPTALRPDATAAVRPPSAPAPAQPSARLPARARAKARARELVARGVRKAAAVTVRAMRIGGIPLTSELLAELEGRYANLRAELDVFRPLPLDITTARHESDVVAINLELLKGEVRTLEHRLQELGMAFAPATGLAGAGARFAELREAVYGLEHQLRNLSLAPSPAAVSGEPAARAESPSTTSTLFNYVGFERRFRGDPDVIVATLQERYGDLLADHQPVVDIGCGRAELLAALAERGVSVIGVEPDPAMVAEGRSRGVTVHQALADEWLSDQPDGSLGSVITTHVVEHLELDDLIRMIELSVRKLRPGGVFIAETPNPASLIVLGNSYILDPTHVRPLHPSLLAFLCETAGFRDVRLHFYAPAESYHLQPVTAPDSPEWVNQVNDAFANLNEVLFGPQEYAVIATTPTSSAVQTPL